MQEKHKGSRPAKQPQEAPEPVDLGDQAPEENKIGKPTVIIVVVLLLGIITALVIYRLSLDTNPAQEPTPSSTGPQDTSCLDDRFAGFFTKPSATDDEIEFQGRFEEHVTNLGGFLCAQGVNLADHSNPVGGFWESEEGYFLFSEKEFRWSIELEDDPAEYYFLGAYTWLPGCEWEGLELTRNNFPCYTVFMRYEQTMNSDVLTDDIYYGGFMVAVEDPSYVSVYNMRSGGAFYMYKVDI